VSIPARKYYNNYQYVIMTTKMLVLPKDANQRVTNILVLLHNVEEFETAGATTTRHP
jgi:hypothetical protein